MGNRKTVETLHKRACFNRKYLLEETKKLPPQTTKTMLFEKNYYDLNQNKFLQKLICVIQNYFINF